MHVFLNLHNILQRYPLKFNSNEGLFILTIYECDGFVYLLSDTQNNSVISCHKIKIILYEGKTCKFQIVKYAVTQIVCKISNPCFERNL